MAIRVMSGDQTSSGRLVGERISAQLAVASDNNLRRDVDGEALRQRRAVHTRNSGELAEPPSPGGKHDGRTVEPGLAGGGVGGTEYLEPSKGFDAWPFFFAGDPRVELASRLLGLRASGRPLFKNGSATEDAATGCSTFGCRGGFGVGDGLTEALAIVASSEGFEARWWHAAKFELLGHVAITAEEFQRAPSNERLAMYGRIE